MRINLLKMINNKVTYKQLCYRLKSNFLTRDY